MKSITTYWNPLLKENLNKWTEIEGSGGNLFFITVAEDSENGDYTRLTLMKDGYDTEKYGAKAHDYPEEIFIVSGRLYDKAFDMWLETGCYASRPIGEVHGPFVADGDTVIMEMSYPSQSKKNSYKN